MSKRVLIFSLAYYPRFVGGAEIAVKEITDRIDPSDYGFDMITLRFDNNLPRFGKIGNVNVYRIGFAKGNPTPDELVRFPMYLNKIFYPVLAFFKAVSLDRKNSYDVLWAIMSYMSFPAVFFRLFYKRNIPFVLTLQDGDPIPHITGRLRIRIVYPFLAMGFRTADFVQTISTYLAKFARSMGYKGQIEVVPNGVDVKNFRFFTPSEVEGQISPSIQLGAGNFQKSEIRKKLNIQEDEKVIITVSRLVEKNAVDDIIKSLMYLPENVKVLVVGTGPRLRNLELLTNNLQLKNRVIFLGHIDYKEIPKYLKISDVFVRPSLSEGMGNSFIEAMAAGVPVIGTPVGGITDFLKDPSTNSGQVEPTGLFCEVRDPKSIAEKVNTLFKDTELRERIIANAQKLAIEKYDWSLIARNMKERVFDRI